MNSAQDTLTGGLPHSEIPGSPIARISPGLFAACHVLHRLSVPRHPPDALASRLITGVFPQEEALTTAATSHEDTSPDRHNTLRLRPRLSASVTSQLSVHPSINTPAPGAQPRPGTVCLASPNAAAAAGGVQRSCAAPVARRFAGGGGERDRTDDLLLAKQALSQLSYTPCPENSNQ